MAFKADMSKAYDHLDWNFIRGMLVLMRFPPNVIQLIMKCITTVSYEILVNGVPLRRIYPSCGLRQGDPLSPYIFVLCTEVLSLNILRMEKDRLIQGIKVIPRAAKVWTKLLRTIVMPPVKYYFVKFLVAGHKKSSSISWCSRLFLSQPKGNGGLGIRRMKEFNQALLANIGWRMTTQPDFILSKSIGAKYGLKWQDGDLLFNDGKSNSSWEWKGIVWGLQLIQPLLEVNISPFSDPGVWNTTWVHGTVPKPRYLELLIESPNLSNLKIKDLICNSKCWDHRLLSMSFDETSVIDILLFQFDVLKATTTSNGRLRRPGITQLRLAITLHYKIHGILQLLRRTVQDFLLRVWVFFRKFYGIYQD
ncbi:uncharacterized protein LOC141648703 [Silene latifolia]|uniref:uncharacterized protein LOC141648703 n=1 Tax=Silene latifolia TaxID=37657 RepID=UPI003D772FAA